MSEVTHTDSVTELPPRHGRRRWRWRGREFTEATIPENRASDGPADTADVEMAIVVEKFKAGLKEKQRLAFDAMSAEVSAAEHARKCGVDGSVVRRRYARIRVLFREHLQTAGLVD